MHEPKLEAASLQRVARGVEAVTRALESIEGLTQGERTQVLLSIAMFSTARSLGEKLRDRFTRREPAESDAIADRARSELEDLGGGQKKT